MVMVDHWSQGWLQTAHTDAALSRKASQELLLIHAIHATTSMLSLTPTRDTANMLRVSLKAFLVALVLAHLALGLQSVRLLSIEMELIHRLDCVTPELSTAPAPLVTFWHISRRSFGNPLDTTLRAPTGIIGLTLRCALVLQTIGVPNHPLSLTAIHPTGTTCDGQPLALTLVPMRGADQLAFDGRIAANPAHPLASMGWNVIRSPILPSTLGLIVAQVVLAQTTLGQALLSASVDFANIAHSQYVDTKTRKSTGELP
jgi:hypothetical protein